jgi:DNA-binding transcriptional regulator YdaS (Cro superfamily)
MTALDQAINCIGGIGALAARLGVKYQAIQKWRRGKVPEDRCGDIEAATAGVVTCDALRPDVEWQRNENGVVTGYLVTLQAAAQEAAA